ncbi:hypothetical protein D9M72_421620 [compost metagenome]
MIQRQPADKDVLRADGQGLAHGAQVGQQVGMAEHDPLGRAGAARGVLQQGDVVRAQHRMDRGAAAILQFLRREHAMQRSCAGLEQGRQRPRLGHRDQDRRLRVGQDAGVALQVVADLRQPRRRVERYRNSARQQHAAEAVEVLGAGGQHDGHGRARAHAAGHQPGGDGRGAAVQLRKADRRVCAVAVMQDDVGALRVAAQVPAQHVRQGGGAVGRLCRRGRAGLAQVRVACAGREVLGGEQGTQQRARGVGLGQHLLWQADAEAVFKAGQQLGTRQAVEAQFAFERAVQRDRHFRLCRRAHGRRHLPHDAEQGILVVLPRGRIRFHARTASVHATPRPLPNSAWRGGRSGWRLD